MSIKERYQSSILGDTLNLDLYAYNNNSLINLYEIQKIEVYFLDPTQVSDSLPDGRRIKQIIYPLNITNLSEGHYTTQLELNSSLYEIGNYIDIWYVKFYDYETSFNQIVNNFKIDRELPGIVDRPFLYDVSFSFSPKKITKDSKRYLKIGFYPTVHGDIGTKTIGEELLDKFYYNLKTTGNLYVKIEMIEGCGFQENTLYKDLNIITDPEWSTVEIHSDNEGYFLIDSTDNGDYNIGIYKVKFKIEIQGQEIISDPFFLQIYD